MDGFSCAGGAAALCLVLVALPAGAAGDARATMRDARGAAVGQVILRETPGGTLVRAELDGLPPGTHALHIHAVGACAPPGGHFNPGGHAHGLLATATPHAGDLPNIHVPRSGSVTQETHNPRLRLDGALFDSDGAAVVVHQGADDYRTDPAGDAGARIACGVIRR